MTYQTTYGKNAERDIQIIEKAKTGHYSMGDLALEYDLSKERIRVILNSAGVNIIAARHAMADKVLRDPANAGKNTSQLSKEFGYSRGFWRNAMSKLADADVGRPRAMRGTSRLIIRALRLSRACEAEFVFAEQTAAIRFYEAISSFTRTHQDENPDIRIERNKNGVKLKCDTNDPTIVIRSA